MTIGCAEHRTLKIHNSVFVVGADGGILGVHRKINALPVGSEAWSTPGDGVAPIAVEPVGPLGVLVCADAYSPWIAARLAAQGARLLISSAAWASTAGGGFCRFAPSARPSSRSTGARRRRTWHRPPTGAPSSDSASYEIVER